MLGQLNKAGEHYKRAKALGYPLASEDETEWIKSEQ
jgi:hypothetical protein